MLLNRFLCILQPFYDLQTRRKSALRTIEARYNALPPQLALWRAVKSGHFFLGAVSIIALLANVLAVGLGALLDERPVQKSYPLIMSHDREPQFDMQGVNRFYETLYPIRSIIYEHQYYVVMANLSYNTPLPPWTSNEFSFLPVNISFHKLSNEEIYTATTTGIGAEPSCFSMGTFTSKDQPPLIDMSFKRPGGSIQNCSTDYRPASMLFNTTAYDIPQGKLAAEVLHSTAATTSPPGPCDQSLLLGWSRSTIKNKHGTMKSSFVICHPVLKMATFRVSFDSQGHIKTAIPVSNFTSLEPHASNSTHHTPSLISMVNKRFLPSHLPWHHGTISSDWFHYLMKLYTKNNAIFDPDAPTPDPESLIPSITAVYKMVFSTYLSLNPYVFAQSNGEGAISGNRTITETRIFVSSAAFTTSTTILGLYVIVIVVFYGWAVHFFLPRMPTTIGSCLAYIAPSKMAREYSTLVRKENDMLGFGRFLGSDGRAQIGIEYSDLVVPINPTVLELGETLPVNSKFGRLWHRNRNITRGDTRL